MNTDAFYDQRLPQPTAQAPEPALTEAELSALAHHRDPSLAGGPETPAWSARDRSITWMRPSELVTTGMTPLLARGTDHQAELVRRVRRAPSTAARAGRRITRCAIARPEQPTPTRDGLGL